MNSNEIDFNSRDSISWRAFEEQVSFQAPEENGVYVIRQAGGRLFGRLKGASDILYIGSAMCKGGLKQRLSHYFHPGPTQWTNLRINSFLSKYDMEIAWFVCDEPINLEHKLLKHYLDDHDELPPFNHADTRRFSERAKDASTIIDSLKVTKVVGK